MESQKASQMKPDVFHARCLRGAGWIACILNAMVFTVGVAYAGSYITVQELANRLGMSCTRDRLTARHTLSDGVNEIIICPGMYSVMVNRRLVSMESRAENRGGEVYIPDSILGVLRGYIRSRGATLASVRTADTVTVPSFGTATPSRTYTPTPSYYPPAGIKGRCKVVIDAGHGGKDPGAIGPTGLREKDVNLGIALAMRDILQYRGVDVVMTRKDDTFVELDERAAICNREQGEIFVSIHANASSSSSTTGSEIYYVDDKGEYTAIARGVAAARTMDIPPFALGCNVWLDMTSKAILFGALLEEYRIESRELARYIQAQLGGHMISYNRGIYGDKGLRVLRFTRCPGVLVEVGFISNPQTESILRQEYYLRSLAESIAEGVIRFKLAQDQTGWCTR